MVEEEPRPFVRSNSSSCSLLKRDNALICRQKSLLPLLGLILAVLGCQRFQAAQYLAALEEYSLAHEGIERSYSLYVPTTYSHSEPFPLVFALHGGGGNGRSMCFQKGGFMEIAEREGFILICPDGLERHWNDGRSLQDYRAHREEIDDVGFLITLLAKLQEEFNVDSRRIFVTGISNGGLMSYRLACEKSEVFRAIAAVTASLPVAIECKPAEPISVMVINGTDDPLVPFDGGSIRIFRKELGFVRSTMDTIQFWVDSNVCPARPKVSMEPNRDPDDETRVRRAAYESCQEGSTVVLYEVQGGGHTWPSSTLYLPESIIGRVSHDIYASQVIWDFFQEQAKLQD